MSEKPWKEAYKDYAKGASYAAIAKKYATTENTVKSWYTRHWKDQVVKDEAWKQDATVESMHNPMIEQESMQLIDINKGKVREQYQNIVTKQIIDTNPKEIMHTYTRNNLPELEPRESRFVEEFLIDLSKTDAAIRAGYGIDSAAAKGCQLYDKPKIYAHIQVALAERRKRTGVNVDTTVRELARIGFVNPARVVDKDGAIREDADEDDLRAIASIKIKSTYGKDGSKTVEREIKFADKNKALEMLGKHQGMFIDRQLILQHNTSDVSNLSTAELEKELRKQYNMSEAIDITPQSSTHAEDIDND
jgi:phage terminase small subunit